MNIFALFSIHSNAALYRLRLVRTAFTPSPQKTLTPSQKLKNKTLYNGPQFN